MLITEKLGFTVIFLILFLGAWLSHTNIEAYVSWYAGKHAMLEWLTIASMVCGMIVCIYRASILAPFRKTSFVVGLYGFAALLLFFAVVEVSRRWGLIGDIIPGWIIAIMFFIYLVILPLSYLKFLKVRKRVDDWAIPLPRFYHIAFYLLLLILHFVTEANPYRPEQLQFGAAWLFFMVLMEPLNRVIFSRTTIER